MTKNTNNNEEKDKNIKATDGAAEAEIPTDEEAVVSDNAENAEEVTVDELIGKLAELQKKAETERARADEMTNHAKRVQAEFDNYRRRTLDNAKKVRDDATGDVLIKIVPVLDVIEQALKMIDDEKVAKGVKMIEDEITKLLASYNVTEIEAEGKDFDPKYHEAIMQAPAEKEELCDTVKEVFQKGYKMGDRVIRPAPVSYTHLTLPTNSLV